MGSTMRCRLFSLLILGLCAVPGLARAAASPWATSDQVSVRLVSAVDATGDLATIPAAIEIKLADGWKTYWRSPGDAGLPPALDWTGTKNLSSAQLRYPVPQRITVLGIQTFGYKHDVILPLDLKVSEPGQPADFKLKLDILVCAEQCVPKTFTLAMALPAGPARPSAEAQPIARARATVPGDSRSAGMTIQRVDEVSDKGQPALEVVATSEQPFARPDVIPEVTPDATLGSPRMVFSNGGRTATFDLPLARKLPFGAKLTGRSVILTLVDGERAMETRATIAQGASAAAEEPGPSLVLMLGIALLGGLILNLMPCVLPVLSLKFLSVVSQGGRAPASVRAGFVATAAGIIASFLVIAGALAVTKAAGHTIGWGIQFQEPAFISAMAVLVTIFACHLAGLFEVPLPAFIANAASNRLGPDENLVGHFVTGAFAALLATPCSAPFLGTAVGFALASGIPAMFGIFLMLGVGLALPYLVVAAVPQIATRLPKPGRWMVWLKQAMAVPLIGTAIWLVTILASQVGAAPAFASAFLLCVIVGLLVLGQRRPSSRRGVLAPSVAVVGVAAIVLPAAIASNVQKAATRADEIIAWQAFDRNEIRSLVSQGKTVFVDVTADWCLTCQANKRFVLSKDDIAKRLNKPTISMKADWTRPNAEIGAYLASYGRYGIPFNIVYGPGAPAGIVLPELLTSETVDAALDKASSAPVKPTSDHASLD